MRNIPIGLPTFYALLAVILFLILSFSPVDGKKVNQATKKNFQWRTDLFSLREEDDDINMTYCDPKLFKETFKVKNGELDSGSNFTSPWVLVLITLTVLAQLKSNLLWIDAIILRKLKKERDRKPDHQIRDDVASEAPKRMQKAKDPKDALFASIYMSKSKGRHRLSGRFISSTTLFLVMFMDVIGMVQNWEQNELILASEVLVTFRLTLAFSSLAVLGSLCLKKGAWKKVALYLTTLVSIVLFSSFMWFSFRYCWIPPYSRTVDIYKNLNYMIISILAALFVGEIIRQYNNFDTHISNIAQTIINGDMDKKWKKMLKDRFEYLKRIHYFPEETRSENLWINLLKFIGSWHISFLCIVQSILYVATFSWHTKEAIPASIAVRVGSTVFIAMSQINDNVIERRLIMKILEISHPKEEGKQNLLEKV